VISVLTLFIVITASLSTCE